MGSIEFSYTDPLVKATHPHHLVQFYENECVLEASVHTFISEGFKNGEGAIIVATQAHREMFLRRLKGDNVPTDELEKNGQLVLLDAEETLSRILKNDFPEHAAFERVIGRVLDEARAHGFPKTRVYGEMVNLLWQKGREEAAIRMEEYWNKIIQRRSFTLFCAYAVNLWNRSGHARALLDICQTHSHEIVSPNLHQLERVVDQAIREVLGEEQSNMVKFLSKPQQSAAPRRDFQAALTWISEHMPLTAEKILLLSRQNFEQNTSDSAFSRG